MLSLAFKKKTLDLKIHMNLFESVRSQSSRCNRIIKKKTKNYQWIHKKHCKIRKLLTIKYVQRGYPFTLPKKLLFILRTSFSYSNRGIKSKGLDSAGGSLQYGSQNSYCNQLIRCVVRCTTWEGCKPLLMLIKYSIFYFVAVGLCLSYTVCVIIHQIYWEIRLSKELNYYFVNRKFKFQ